MNAAWTVNGGILMLNEEFPEYTGGKSNTTEALGGTPVTLHLQVTDADSVFNQAVAAGATVKFPLMDQFWGDRAGTFTDPYGYVWTIATRKEELTPEEMQQRQDAFMKNFAAAHAGKS